MSAATCTRGSRAAHCASVLLHGGLDRCVLVRCARAAAAVAAALSSPADRGAGRRPRAIGVVQHRAEHAASRDARSRAARRRPPRQSRRRTRRQSRRRQPRRRRRPQPKTAEPPKPETPPPTAAGGATGGKGTDVANVDTPGIEFPYPGYTAEHRRAKFFANSRHDERG